MQVSTNELSALLKQVFEGCGFDTGRNEGAAEMVLYLQTHGLDGLSLLAASLSHIAQGHIGHPSPPLIEFTEDSDNRIEFDVADQSILSCGGLLSNLLAARALQTGVCVATINNVQGHAFIAKPLLNAQALGLHGVAYWQLRSEALESATIWQMLRSSGPHRAGDFARTACANCPCIASYSFSGTNGVPTAHNQLVVAYAKEPRRLDEFLLQQAVFKNVHLLANMSVLESHKQYQMALTNGLNIDESLWKRLHTIASRVLVESSEQSRKGAGV